MEYIEFPALGWTFNIDPVLGNFELFGIPISIRWYGVMIALGFLLAILYAVRNAHRFGVELDPMTDVALVSTAFAILGARVYYIVFYDGIATLWEEPLKIFRIWDGGLAIYGAVIMAFVTGIWMCRVKKVPTLGMFDLASIGFLIGQSVGRWGNFFNQEAFGGNTTLPWGMTGSIIGAGTHGAGYDTTLPVHPTFLYESLWCLAGIILLHILSKKAYTFSGKIFCGYVMWYGTGRFLIEGLRTDSLMLGTMRVSQLLAILSVIGGLAAYYILKTRSERAPIDLFDRTDPILTDEELEALETETPAEDIDEDAVETDEDTAQEEETADGEVD